MKLTAGNYEIDIKVKRDYDSRNNKKATEAFLNELIIAFMRTAEEYRIKKYPALYECYFKLGTDIYKALENAGAYDHLNK